MNDAQGKPPCPYCDFSPLENEGYQHQEHCPTHRIGLSGRIKVLKLNISSLLCNFEKGLAKDMASGKPEAIEAKEEKP